MELQREDMTEVKETTTSASTTIYFTCSCNNFFPSPKVSSTTIHAPPPLCCLLERWSSHVLLWTPLQLCQLLFLSNLFSAFLYLLNSCVRFWITSHVQYIETHVKGTHNMCRSHSSGNVIGYQWSHEKML